VKCEHRVMELRHNCVPCITRSPDRSEYVPMREWRLRFPGAAIRCQIA
jgi:hypothetical protein